MHYEITASQGAVRKNLTTAQRMSSLFTEFPRIGTHTIRRGQVLRLNEAEMKFHSVTIERLLKAGAIQVVAIRDQDAKGVTPPPVKVAAPEAPAPKPPAPPPPPPPPPAPMEPPKAPVPAQAAPEPDPTPPVQAPTSEPEPAPEVPQPEPLTVETATRKKGKR